MLCIAFVRQTVNKCGLLLPTKTVSLFKLSIVLSGIGYGVIGVGNLH